MKHSVDEILNIAYHFYPRGLSPDDPRYSNTDEISRLVEARKRAGAERSRWTAMLTRLGQQFPDCIVHDDSVHLPTGNMDACHCGKLFLPTASPKEHRIMGFMISFLLPHYIIYNQSWTAVNDPTKELTAADYARGPSTWPEIRFDSDSTEQPYAQKIAQEMEGSYHCERMPPDIGRLIIPDLATPMRLFGKVTICDCLFSDHTRWLPNHYYDLSSTVG